MIPAQGTLRGCRVLVPRAPQQAPALSERVRALGGEPVEAPVIHIEEGDRDALRAAVRELGDGAYAAVCLTSPNGVEALADAVAGTGRPGTEVLDGVYVACVGPGTAAALWDRLGIRADLVPDRATTQALGQAMPAGSGRVLLPRADLASPTLVELLVERGYEPVEVTAYRTAAPERLPPDVVDDLAAGRIDLLAFGSPSTVRNFVDLMGGRPWQGAVVSIGPVTSDACRALGLDVAVEAERHDLDGLAAALVRAAERVG